MKRTYVLFAIFGAGVAACSGGGSNAPSRTQPVAVATASMAPVLPSTAPASFAKVTLQILVPPRSASSRRSPHYVSASTQSLVVNAAGTSTTVDVTPASPGCSSGSTGTTCTAAIVAPVGSDAFSVVSYDGMDGSGSELSTANLTQTITFDAANIVKLTLDGVVASVAISFPSPVPACTAAASVPVTITARDADENAIVGAAPYDRTISLSYADATNDSTFSGSTAAKPGDGATISYNGHYEPGGVVTATATGVPTATATFYPTPTVCAEYALPAQQSVEVLLRKYVTLGPDGNIYFPEQKLMSLGHVITSGATLGTILETPITSTVAAGDTTSQIIDAGVDTNGNFAITDADDGIDTLSPATMTQSNYQDAANKRSPEVIAPGPDGRLWFTDSSHQAIGAISTTGTYSAVIPLPNLIAQFNGIVASLDKKAMWVAEAGSYKIARVPIDGSPMTEYTIPNPTSGTGSPGFLASSHDGYLWFTEQDPYIGRISETDGTVTLFPLPDANSFTYTIAQGPDGNMWFTYITNGQDYIGKITPAGVITKYPIGRVGNFATFSIAAGPTTTNDMWFDEVLNGSERVGYLTI